MDIRDLLQKLDTLSEAEVSMGSVEAAVSGQDDEQARAKTLNNMAWKNNLPGLYDPVTGKFVPKQSEPTGAMGSPTAFRMVDTAPESAAATLGAIGLIPKNSKDVAFNKAEEPAQAAQPEEPAAEPEADAGQPASTVPSHLVSKGSDAVQAAQPADEPENLPPLQDTEFNTKKARMKELIAKAGAK